MKVPDCIFGIIGWRYRRQQLSVSFLVQTCPRSKAGSGTVYATCKNKSSPHHPTSQHAYHVPTIYGEEGFKEVLDTEVYLL